MTFKYVPLFALLAVGGILAVTHTQSQAFAQEPGTATAAASIDQAMAQHHPGHRALHDSLMAHLASGGVDSLAAFLERLPADSMASHFGGIGHDSAMVLLRSAGYDFTGDEGGHGLHAAIMAHLHAFAAHWEANHP